MHKLFAYYKQILLVLILSFTISLPTFAGYEASSGFTIKSYEPFMGLYVLDLTSPTNDFYNNAIYIDVGGVKTKLDSTFCDAGYIHNSYDGNYHVICDKHTDFFSPNNISNTYFYNDPNYTGVSGIDINMYMPFTGDLYLLVLTSNDDTVWSKDIYIKQLGNYYKLDTDYCGGSFVKNMFGPSWALNCSKSGDFFSPNALSNLYFYNPVTCSDGIQNQDETAIDKGGACNLLAPTMPNVTSQNGTKSTVFSHSYKATDSDSPDADISYSLVSGTLPNGTSLNTSNGTVSGTPTTAGTFTFTIGVTDSVHTDSKEYSIVIADSGNNTGGGTISSTNSTLPVQLESDIFNGSDTLETVFGTPLTLEAQAKISEYDTFIKLASTKSKISGCSGICFIINQ